MEQTPWHSLPLGDVFARLNVQRDGLNDDVIKERRSRFGTNEIIVKRQDNAWRILIRQFKNPLIAILVIAGIITIAFRSYLDSIVILGVVIVNTAIGFIEERRALLILHSIEDRQKFFAFAKRKGKWKKVSIKDLVPGDIIRLRPGDQVPADARLIRASNMQVGEAILTGESSPVEKTAEAVAPASALADRTNMVWRGTEILDGTGEALVVATGNNTEFGKISGLLAAISETKTPFERKVRRLGRFVSIVILVLSIALAVLGVLTGHAFSEMLLVAVAVAVSAIPESLPIAVTVILAIGTVRILKKKGLVRHISAAEALGATSVILTDKTGTLTAGTMEVAAITTPKRTHGLFELTASKSISKNLFPLEAALLTVEGVIEEDSEGKMRIHASPTDRAIIEAGLSIGLRKHDVQKPYTLLREIPFSSSRKFAAAVLETPRAERIAFFLGAPEIILRAATHIHLDDRAYSMRDEERADIHAEIGELAQKGFRLLGVGYRVLGGESAKEDILEGGVFVGLISLRDPVRANVPETITESRSAGIRTVMVTGDHVLTAQAVAREIGLMPKNHSALTVMEGRELETTSVEDLAHQIRSIDVFARVSPSDKVKIVTAWQMHPEVVAMTGDGVNDAPALKKADVGVAVQSGTDVAKQTADVILLDNSFPTIVAAVREGRVIIDNLKKVVTYLLSDGLTELLLISISLLAGLPIPVLPTQILWVNLLEGSLPSIALAFEPAQEDVMKLPPAERDAPLLDGMMKRVIAIVSAVSVVFTMGVYLLYYGAGENMEHTRTVVFGALAVNSLFFVFSIRNLRAPIWETPFASNRYLLGSVLVGFGIFASALYVPFLQSILHTEPLGRFEWLMLVGFGILNIVVIEAVKWAFIRRSRRQKLHE